MADRTLTPGIVVGGRYRTVRELGRGGMGVVWVVEHVNTGGLLAMKVMLDGTAMIGDRAARFRREARASARVGSDHVVKVTDADTAAELDGAPYMVMELLDGTDLEKLLVQRGSLDPAATLEVLVQVARALDKAHAAGVIHRDLKPENVFLHRREDGTKVVKVLDFGISKILARESEVTGASLAMTSDLMGTPLYMAPEQARAQSSEVGPATDVWAIGLLVVRMLTGTNYWSAETLTDLLIQIVQPHRDPPSQKFPGLTPDFDAWFAKSCATEPKARFQSVGEQVTELARVLALPLPNVSQTAPGLGPAPIGAAETVLTPPSPGELLRASTPRSAPEARLSSEPGAVALGSSTTGPMSTSAPVPVRRLKPLAIGGIVLACALAGSAFFFATGDKASVTAETGLVAPPPASVGSETVPVAGEPSSAISATSPASPASASASASSSATVLAPAVTAPPATKPSVTATHAPVTPAAAPARDARAPSTPTKTAPVSTRAAPAADPFETQK